MNTSDFLSRWRDLRAHLGDSQEEFGRRLSITRSYASQIESGKIPPSAKLLRAFSALESRSKRQPPEPDPATYIVEDATPYVATPAAGAPAPLPPVEVILPFVSRQTSAMQTSLRTAPLDELNAQLRVLLSYVEMIKASAEAKRWRNEKQPTASNPPPRR